MSFWTKMKFVQFTPEFMQSTIASEGAATCADSTQLAIGLLVKDDIVVKFPVICRARPAANVQTCPHDVPVALLLRTPFEVPPTSYSACP